MGAFDFGQSWFGVVFNPAGYLLQRKSPAEAARDYIKSNPTRTTITQEDTEITFQEDRNSWIDKCANKLKSDDVGKSRANCLSACQGVFDADTNVISVKNAIAQRAEEEKAAIQKKLEEAGKSIVVYIIIFLFVGLIVYLLTSDN